MLRGRADGRELAGGLPDVPIQRTMKSFQLAVKHGCIGVSIDSVLEKWATQGPLYYVLARMTWNLSQDWQAVLNDYYSRGFGLAASDNASGFQRFQFDAATTSPANSKVSDLSTFIHCEHKTTIREPWESAGYFFQFGGRYNTVAQLTRSGESLRQRRHKNHAETRPQDRDGERPRRAPLFRRWQGRVCRAREEFTRWNVAESCRILLLHSGKNQTGENLRKRAARRSRLNKSDFRPAELIHRPRDGKLVWGARSSQSCMI